MKRLPLILLMVVAAGFAAGLWRLFSLRFASGETYPPYSSLRSDPLGCKALFDSLDRLVTAARNYRARLPEGGGAGTTLFLLGLPSPGERYETADLLELEQFAASGGRVVISFLPRFEPPAGWQPNRPAAAPETNRVEAAEAEEVAPPGKQSSPRARRRSAGRSMMSMAERWKFGVGYGVAERDDHGVYRPVKALRKVAGSLPESMEWHTAVWFDKPDPAWRIVYAREKDRALAMERRLGAGALVLLSDSYPLSNEALRWHRRSDWLAWVAGPSRKVVFDEFHLGVQEAPGVATLARKYRLHGVALALLALGVLAVWKNSTSFLPPLTAESGLPEPDLVEGRHSGAGFVNLLRRSIQPADLLEVCFQEWRKSCARGAPAAAAELEAVMDAERRLPAREREPLRAYERLCRALERRSWTRAVLGDRPAPLPARPLTSDT